MQRRKFILFAITFLMVNTAFSQTNNLNTLQDTIRIPLITISSPFFPLEDYYLTPADSSYTQNLPGYADAGLLLNSLTPLYLRNYGPGLVYSISLRGGTSAQTEVLWNGLNINNPMQGQADLSLIKISPGATIMLHPNSYEHGLSGVVEITEKLDAMDSWKYYISNALSTLKSNESSLSIGYGTDGFKTKLNIDLNQSQNDFSYKKDGKLFKSENNLFVFHQVKWQLERKWKKKNKFNFNAWVYKSQREIPPSLFENESDAIQKDESFKITGIYTYVANKIVFRSQTAWFFDKLQYDSSIKSIHSNSHSQRLIQQFYIDYSLRSLGDIRVELGHEIQNVESNAYDQNRQVNYRKVEFKYRKNWQNKHYLAGGIRTGLKDMSLNPLLPFVHYSYSPLQKLRLMVSAGRKLRYPSMNDLYWAIGGNGSLKPELAMEMESGFNLIIGRNVEIEGKAYLKKVENWIQWLPENGIFKAANIENVAGRGLELSVNYDHQFDQAKLHLKTSYNLNQIRKTENSKPGLQLIYSPQNLVKQNLRFSWKDWGIQLDHSWTDRIFTATDHSASLDPYYIIDTNISREFTLKNNKISAWLKVVNLLDKQYFTIRNYVMPGRVFRIGISIQN